MQRRFGYENITYYVVIPMFRLLSTISQKPTTSNLKQLRRHTKGFKLLTRIRVVCLTTRSSAKFSKWTLHLKARLCLGCMITIRRVKSTLGSFSLHFQIILVQEKRTN